MKKNGNRCGWRRTVRYRKCTFERQGRRFRARLCTIWYTPFSLFEIPLTHFPRSRARVSSTYLTYQLTNTQISNPHLPTQRNDVRTYTYLFVQDRRTNRWRYMHEQREKVPPGTRPSWRKKGEKKVLLPLIINRERRKQRTKAAKKRDTERKKETEANLQSGHSSVRR